MSVEHNNTSPYLDKPQMYWVAATNHDGTCVLYQFSDYNSAVASAKSFSEQFAFVVLSAELLQFTNHQL